MRLVIDNKLHLQGAPADLRRKLTEHFTVPNPVFIEAVKMNRFVGNIPKTLSFTEDHDASLTVPRGAARAVLDLARSYGQIEIEDRRLTLPEIALKSKATLRPYQEQAVNGILQRDFGVLEAGTGSGKTVMALALIAARRQPTLILAHSKELLYQWQGRIRAFLDNESGLIGDGRFDVQPVTVGIVNSVKKHLDDLTDRFGQIIVDECHRTPSTTFTDVVLAFPAKYSLGLSATPYRRDGLDKLIGWTLGEHRQRVELSTLHEVGAVLRPRITTKTTLFWYQFNDDYTKMLTALVEDQERNKLIVKDIRQQAATGGLSLVVSDRTAHLEALAEMAGVERGAILTGKTPAKQRRQIVEDLSTGEVTTLFSTLSLIGEGFDCPNMDALFLATPVKFSGRLKQVVGRVLRPSDGKEPRVFDYFDERVGVLRHQWKIRQRVFAAMQ